MFTKSALSITASRFTLVYKVIIYILLITLLFSIIGYSVLAPTFKKVKSQIDDLEIKSSVINYLQSVGKVVINSDGVDLEVQDNYYEIMISKFSDLGRILSENSKTMDLGLIFFIILVFLFSIAYSLLYLPVTQVIFEFMSCNCRYGFVPCYLANFKSSVWYAFVSCTFMLIYFVATLAVSIGLYFVVSIFNKFLGLMTLYLTIGICLSLRRALFYGWLPAIVVDKESVWEALKTTLKLNKKHFLRTTLIYLSFYILLSTAFAIMTIFTFGVGAVFVFGFNLIFFCVLDMVLYYHNIGHKYYVDEQTVINPRRKYGTAVLDNPLDLDEQNRNNN